MNYHVIGIGSTSPIKIRALRVALRKINCPAQFQIQNVKSGVANQPFGTREIQTGARNRAQAIFSTKLSIALGIESGIIKLNNQYYEVTCVLAKKGKFEKSAWTLAMPVPRELVDIIRSSSVELGEVAKRRAKVGGKDSIAFLSGGALTREATLVPAIIAVLSPEPNWGRQ